jgi:hypothetical protein
LRSVDVCRRCCPPPTPQTSKQLRPRHGDDSIIVKSSHHHSHHITHRLHSLQRIKRTLASGWVILRYIRTFVFALVAAITMKRQRLPCLLLLCISSSASLLVLVLLLGMDLPSARGYMLGQPSKPGTVPGRGGRRARAQPTGDGASSSSSSLSVGYSPAVPSPHFWTTRQTRHSSLLLPPRGRNATAWDNPYLDQSAISAPARTTTTELAELTMTPASATENQPFHVYVDLDGVLCDFEHGVRSIFPEMTESMSLQDLERHDMWRRISSQASFFNTLPWAKGGKELWDAVRHLNPDILTGVPASFAESRAEKFEWCARELFGDSPDGGDDDDERARQPRPTKRRNRLLHMVEHVDMAGQHFRHARVNENPRFVVHSPFRQRNHRRRLLRQSETAAATPRTQRVITCWSTNKHHESRPGAVLIDDCLRLRDDWERKGGIFIHHETGNAQNTLKQLVERGVLDEYYTANR